MLERRPLGALSRTPARMSAPIGWPSPAAKRSPLTPATVATDETSRSMALTLSFPRTALFESTGFSWYRPVGFGADNRWTTTGPCAVNSTWRE